MKADLASVSLSTSLPCDLRQVILSPCASVSPFIKWEMIKYNYISELKTKSQ